MLSRSLQSIFKTPLTKRSHLVLTSSLGRQYRPFHSSFSFQAVKPFLLADIGEGITECEVIQWFVEPGSTVAEFDKICEVQSDKASVEISSRYAGKVLKLHYGVNDIAKVGSPLVDIETGDDGHEQVKPNIDENHQEPKEEQVVVNQPPADFSSSNGTSVLATPAVRKLAKDKNIELSTVVGTGKDGRILKEDLLSTEIIEEKKEIVMNTTPLNDSTEKPLNMIQKAMFKSMTQSLSIPQLGYKDDIEIDATTEYRKALNQHIAKHPDLYQFKKMTYLPIFVKCLSIALSHYPVLNASLSGDPNDINSMKITYRSSHNIGIAMDTPQGLIVPNIKDVQKKTIFEIASEIHRLSELGKKNAIPMADLKGGTITISNIGTIGGTYANPVIVTSELAIVALGKIQKLPRFDSHDNIVARHIMPISWSADHRIIDGATIARFGNHWKRLIENPALLASELR